MFRLRTCGSGFDLAPFSFKSNLYSSCMDVIDTDPIHKTRFVNAYERPFSNENKLRIAFVSALDRIC